MGQRVEEHERGRKDEGHEDDVDGDVQRCGVVRAVERELFDEVGCAGLASHGREGGCSVRAAGGGRRWQLGVRKERT